ncbi:hypothetical protein PsorP6_002818 [Peronosclerospora sorghi]|uniref:Uncharacterized protein n=1 Tax=Peronosclerospora sorghi TaxID=230839 RepID=A0ACC0VKU0_9STRA|nr:hypothetical protein PsorP6_002818 [Peronosclerospora sorghi]
MRCMTIVKRLRSNVERWHLLGRYYVNKWHYDGSKLLDRVLYGQGSTENGPHVASVAFMITRSMRQQLVNSGFPPSAISKLPPATAQKIIADKIAFSQFEKLRVRQEMEHAKQALVQDEPHQRNSFLIEEKKEENKTETSSTSGALVVNHVQDQDAKEKNSSS